MPPVDDAALDETELDADETLALDDAELDGAIVGATVGATVGRVVGADVGAIVGAIVGRTVGTTVGCAALVVVVLWQVKQLLFVKPKSLWNCVICLTPGAPVP
jgi:hypothetical protein